MAVNTTPISTLSIFTGDPTITLNVTTPDLLHRSSRHCVRYNNRAFINRRELVYWIDFLVFIGSIIVAATLLFVTSQYINIGSVIPKKKEITSAEVSRPNLSLRIL